jgi:hypothetical protein
MVWKLGTLFYAVKKNLISYSKHTTSMPPPVAPS